MQSVSSFPDFSSPSVTGEIFKNQHLKCKDFVFEESQSLDGCGAPCPPNTQIPPPHELSIINESIIGGNWVYDKKSWYYYTQTYVTYRVSPTVFSTCIAYRSPHHRQLVSAFHVCTSSTPSTLDTILESEEEDDLLRLPRNEDNKCRLGTCSQVLGYWVCPTRENEVKTSVHELFEYIMNDAIPQNGENVTAHTRADSVIGDVSANLLSLLLGTAKIPDNDMNTSYEASASALESEGYTVLGAFRWAVQNWQSCKTMPLWNHISNIMSIGIVLGFLPEHLSEIHCNSICIFRATALNKFADAFTILDGFINALNYFVESVVASWECGSLLPFLYERSMNARLDQLYFEVSDTMPLVRDGTFQREGRSYGALLNIVRMAMDAFQVARDAAASSNSFTKKLFADRYNNLASWHLEILTMRRSGAMTEQPPAIVFHGAPGCGKSLMVTAMQKLICALKHIKHDPATVANIIPDDGYHSQVFNHTLFIVLDDIANRPLKYDPSLAVAPILQICNNVQFSAVKAELELKGKVLPELLAVIGTTNVRSMNISQLSQQENSIKRRIILVDVVVKPSFRNDLGGLMQIDRSNPFTRPETVSFGGTEFDKTQLFTINEPCKRGWRPYQFVESDGSVTALDNLEIDQYFKYINKILVNWYSNQKEMVVKHNDLTFCDACEKCHCIECECMEKQGILTDLCDAVYSTATRSVTKAISERLLDFGPSWSSSGATSAVSTLTESLFNELSRADITQWWYWIPDDWWSTEFCRKCAVLLNDVSLRKKMRRWERAAHCWCIAMCVSFVLSFILAIDVELFLLALFCCGAWQWCTWVHLRLRLGAYNILSRRRDLIKAAAQAHRNSFGPWIKMLLAAIPACGMILAFYRLISQECADAKAAQDPTPTQQVIRTVTGHVDTSEEAQNELPEEKQGSFFSILGLFGPREKPDLEIEPSKNSFLSISEEALRAKNEKKEEWEKKVIRAQYGVKNPNMTSNQLIELVRKNVSVCEVLVNGVFKPNDCITWLCTNLFVCAAHSVPKHGEVRTIRLRDNESPTSAQKYTVTRADFLICKDADFAFGFLTSRSKTSLLSYLNHNPDSFDAVFVCKRVLPEGFVTVQQETVGRYDPHMASSRVVLWQRPVKTQKGECGGAYISKGKNPSILGFHFAGMTRDLTLARSFCPSQDDCEFAMEHFCRTKASVAFTSNLPPAWARVCNGEKTFTPGDSHSVERFDEQVLWCRNHYLTPEEDDYRDLNPFAQQKEEECEAQEDESDDEQPDTVETSDVSDDEVKQGILALGTRPCAAFYRSKAVDTLIAQEVKNAFNVTEDFGKPRFGRSMWPKSAMYSFFPSPGVPREHLDWAVRDYMTAFQVLPPYLLENLRPLTNFEILNGIDGVRFIGSMNFSTSAGLCFPGGKKKYSNEFIDAEGMIRKEFLPEIWKDVQECIDMLERGLRVPWIYNATPKDEPTLSTKEKVRLFMVAQISLVILVRKYFTPVCRVLQMTTVLSECAVGMNCLSMDWEEVWTRLSTFQNVFDGDHSKYDVRKPPQVSVASYRIMIEIAALGNYTAHDLFVMSMIMADLVYPLVNFNGFVYCLDGSTPSGVPVTVIVNGLDNSLLNRCAYRNVYPSARPGDFRRYVAHINYGDDFINCVSGWRTRFNFLTMQEYLRKYDMIITPGLKEAEGKKFVNSLEDLVFLKRFSTSLPGLTYRVGKLDLASIHKMMMCVLSSSHLTLAQQTTMNVDTALRELVIHGEEVYEEYRSKLYTILDEKGLVHTSVNIHKTFGMLFEEIFSAN